VYEGYVYLPAGRFLYCIEEESGKVIWGRRDPSFGFYGTPTIEAGKIFYGNRKGFYSRELQNGHIVWENMEIYTYGGFPSYWNGMVYTVSKEFQKESAFLVALNEGEGTVRWATPLENVVNIFSPVIYDEKIYLTWGNLLGVFNAETGERLFETHFGTPVASNAVFSQGMIFISLADGRIIKVDPETGNYTLVYNAPYGTQFAVVGSYLFVPVKGGQGALVTVDAESGRTVNRIPTAEGEPSALTITKGIVFLPAENTLFAIGDGRLLAAYSPRKRVGRPLEGAIARGEAPGTRKTEAGTPGTGSPGSEAGKAPTQPEPGVETAPKAPGAEKPETHPGTAGTGTETAVIRGELKDRDSGRPLDGTVEATTELESGDILRKEEEVRQGKFEIEVPRQGQTDLIFSSPGYTFQSITLPNAKAIDDLSLQPLELSLSRVKRGTQLSFESIQFFFGSANLGQSSLGTLQKMLEMLRDNPSVKVEIAGHTDSTGPEDVNQTLSELRAEAVAHWLIMNGISSKRIVTKGYGESKPVADNETEAGRRKNRRTEVRILED
jgi:outer membrane protein OmpA-like peptidoglycan-associated protein/outer membrane protein assembly factor BamB